MFVPKSLLLLALLCCRCLALSQTAAAEEVGRGGLVEEEEMVAIEVPGIGKEDWEVEMEPNQAKHRKGEGKVKDKYCNDIFFTGMEPTLASLWNDTMANFSMPGIELPVPVREYFESFKPSNYSKEFIDAASDLSGKLGNTITRTELPLKAFISDGVFTITGMTKDTEIKLEVANGLFCSLESIKGNWLRDKYCNCDGVFPFNILTNSDNQNSNMCAKFIYCKSGVPCVLPPLDPFRKACVSSSSSSITVDYNRTVPYINATMAKTAVVFINSVLTTDTGLQYPDGLKDTLEGAAEWLDKNMFAFLPKYPTFFLTGVILISLVDAIATNPIFQLTLVFVGGLMLAAAAIVYFLWKSTTSALDRLMPTFVTSTLGPVFLFGSYTLLKPESPLWMNLWEIVCKFWNEGFAGYWWLGKLFFLLSGSICVFLTTFFGFFSSKSTSLAVLRHLIMLVGATLVSFGTSNSEIAAVLVVVALSWDQVAYLFRRARLNYLGSQQMQTNALIGGKMSKKEYEKQTAEFTEMQLAALQNHLINNPEVFEQTKDKLKVATEQGQNKNEVASQLFMFVKGITSGIPADHRKLTPHYEDKMPHEGAKGEDTISRLGRPIVTLSLAMVFIAVFAYNLHSYVEKQLFEDPVAYFKDVIASLKLEE